MIDRRGFGKVLGVGTGATALSVAGLQGASAAQTVPTADAATVPAAVPATASGGRTGSPRLKQIRAGPLDVGYAELGPAHGPAAICLHGWPYDIHSYVDVAPLLAAQGYRVIVPYLRGHGTTRFLSDRTFRNAQQCRSQASPVRMVT